MNGTGTAHRPERKARRVAVPENETVHCFFAGFEGRITTISEAGAFIDTVFPAAVGAEFDVVIKGLRPVHARCVSRDPRPGWGMGVEFTHVQEADRHALLHLIRRLAHGEVLEPGESEP